MVQLRQFFEKELFVGLDVFSYDAQQEIDAAENDIAVHDFGEAVDGFGKCGQVTSAMRGKLDVREDHRRQTDLFTIKYDGLVLDDAVFSQALNAPPASGLRQADAFPDSRRVDVRLRLQKPEDLAINVVERGRLHDLCAYFSIYA